MFVLCEAKLKETSNRKFGKKDEGVGQLLLEASPLEKKQSMEKCE
jgi:hypothetical protein